MSIPASSRPPRRVAAAFIPCAALALAACAAPSSSRSAPAPVLPDLGGSTLIVHYGGVETLLTDPRDAGLVRVLDLVDERLLELVEELGRPAPPPGSFEILREALQSPWTLRLGLDGAGLDGAAPVPVRATLALRPPSVERAAALAERVQDLVRLFGLPSMSADEHPGLTEVETPVGTLYHGTLEEGRTFLLAWGEPDARPWDGAGLLPPGARASGALALDLGALLDLVRANLPEDDPEAEEVRRMLAFVGLEPGVPVLMAMAAGPGPEQGHSVLRYQSWARLAAASGALAEGPIAAETLALVPGDATLVSLTRFEPTMFTRLGEVMGPEYLEARGELEQALGIALGPDLLEPLGATFGLYLSDATGGGGLASAVLLAEVDDETRLAATLALLAAELRDLALEEAEGRVRVRSFEHGAVVGYQLDFPGLPVPLSPSVAMAHGHLFLAATPGALSAALDVAARPDGSRSGWRAGVAAAGLGAPDDLQSLFFVDVPRFARAGYGPASLLGAGLANAVRSPADPARDPGLAWPAQRELLHGARPLVTMGRVVDGDLVSQTASDRSVALHVAAWLGVLPELLPGLALIGAFAGGRSVGFAEPPEQLALADRAAADIWQILSALDGWALENGGLYPDSLEALTEPSGEDQLAWLEHTPVDPWGNEYVYLLDAEGVHVLSYGADGVPGGEGEAADILSDALQESWDDEEGGEWELMELEELEEPEEDE
ncbi:MAG TPA: type II secretion system protein GspG [Planctomycetota bacterium]